MQPSLVSQEQHLTHTVECSPNTENCVSVRSLRTTLITWSHVTSHSSTFAARNTQLLATG